MFNRTVARTLIFAGIIPAFPYRLSARQAEGDTVIVSDKVGKIIDLRERNRYQLFQSVRGFQSAVLLKKPDGGYWFEVILTDTVAHHDVTVQIFKTEEQIQKIREYLDAPAPKPVPVEVEKRGERLSVEMKDGTTVEGELLAVRGGRLLLKNSSASAAGPELGIDRIARITLQKKSRFFQSVGTGFLIAGLYGTMTGLSAGSDKPGTFLRMTAAGKALFGGLVCGILGAAAGAVIGLFTGIDESIDLTSMPPGRMDKIIERLKTWSRYGKEMSSGWKAVPLSEPEKIPPEAEGDTVVVNEKVGKIIDQEERNRYQLFQSVRGFQSAVLLKKPDGSYVFEVIHADTVAHHDVTVQMIQTEEQIQQIREYLDMPVEKPVPIDAGKR